VPYPSSPQAMTALIRNDVQMVCLVFQDPRRSVPF
jgi:hypothetical protein